jgi:hypothetical protein
MTEEAMTINHFAPWILALIAFIALLLTGITNRKQWQYQKSDFRLKSSLDAFKVAHKLLSDGNNDRVTWILAARALKRGIHMTEGLTEDVHKDVLEVELDQYRIIFGKILGCDNEEKK